ncbi:MAG: DUF885 family protein, partial [Acidobacteriales bacterium]|nr:DUF885 family protein [Terriglobales bacterium]
AFDQHIILMKHGLADHLIQPRILLEKVAVQAKNIGSKSPEESPFFEPAKKFPATFSDADKQRLQASLTSVIRDQVNPAYLKFADFVAKDYAPHGRTDVGVWSLPNGDDYYRYSVKRSTTTDLTPDQIHQIGLQQVERDHEEMLKIAKKFGYNDLKSFDAANKANPALHPKSREEMLDLYRKYNDQMWAKLPQFFGTLPKAKVEVLPVESFREKEASAAQYVDGTPDGKRPGHIMVNTGSYQDRSTLDIETTAYHEGVPGHHLQISIAQELPELPKFRQHAFYVAFIEGWGLYSEQFGVDAGLFQDPYSLYGHYQDDLLRAIRLVVDTGLHSKHWTRQQVVDYFHNNSGIEDVEVQSETDRYISWPAQALGYKVGQLKFLSLREHAKQELGDKFDIRKFHDVLLTGGALPLDIVEQRVNTWIAQTKSGAPAIAVAK